MNKNKIKNSASQSLALIIVLAFVNPATAKILPKHGHDTKKSTIKIVHQQTKPNLLDVISSRLILPRLTPHAIPESEGMSPLLSAEQDSVLSSQQISGPQKNPSSAKRYTPAGVGSQVNAQSKIMGVIISPIRETMAVFKARSEQPVPASKFHHGKENSETRDTAVDQSGQPEPPMAIDEPYERYRQQVHWWTQHQGYLRQSLDRASPVLYLIVEELEKHRVPVDFALLPILESGYRPTGLSTKSALGLWQFIPPTADVYQLPRDAWYDARLDIMASTHAAARYLATLGRRFQGDWLLAAAAYNAGEGRVSQAMQANHEQNLPVDFWSLKLPEETRVYVPRLLALSALLQKPEFYKKNVKPVPNRPHLAHVRYEGRETVETLARLADMRHEDFQYLNPAFLQGVVPGDQPLNLLIPLDRKNNFLGRLMLAAVAKSSTLFARPPQITHNPLSSFNYKSCSITASSYNLLPMFSKF